MPVHDVAARGFGEAAGAYDRNRPGYPPEAVDHLVERFALDPRSLVADIGAGTGKLTRLLQARCRVVAVEPLAGMRAVLAAELPAVATVGAVAEALPFPDAALDALVVAQAFHWFESAAALDEFARVTRAGGGIVLLWNAWNDSVEWVAALHRVVAGAGATPQWQRGHFSRAWAAEALDAHDGFRSVDVVRIPYAQVLDRDGIVDRVATTSHIVAASPETRAETLRAVRDLLERHDALRGREHVEFPYVTELYLGVRA